MYIDIVNNRYERYKQGFLFKEKELKEIKGTLNKFEPRNIVKVCIDRLQAYYIPINSRFKAIKQIKGLISLIAVNTLLSSVIAENKER